MKNRTWKGLIGCFHQLYVRPGEVYLVEAGLPHAVGEGILMVELQEPTDFTLRIERVSEGRLLEDEICHLGMGFDLALEALRYENYSREEILERFCLKPKILKKDGENEEWELVGVENTDCFRAKKLVIRSQYCFDANNSFYIAITIQGER